jgi:hypothetical protein
MKTIAVMFILLLLLFHSEAFSANPAPDTEEAVKKIATVAAMIQPKYDASLSKEESLRKGVEFWRNIFEKAGYNYDDTIIKVVNDMRHHPERLPKGSDTIFSMIYVGVHFILADCKYEKVDCLQFFRSDAAESVEWLMKNTEFKM